MTIEILAPAGSPDALRAAVESGANAVYLGLKQFNARGNAVNFSTEELAQYVPMAHANNTNVYLTLNTLVKMNEMGPLLESLARAADCGIDGVIMQDIGLGRVMARHFPSLRRHASTQMAIHNLEGVQFCVDEGFERVVLARELTLQEIAEIRAAFPRDVIQLEVFCHGAMCYTYSGMCFFSGSVGGRSGNRGECAYTCRKGYRIHNDTRFPMAPDPKSFNNYLFSMKDMNTLDILPQLVESGVDSLKIEGRRKGPSYVSASVRAYRERLDARDTSQREHDLRLAFGRDYTNAFYQRGQFGDAPIDLTTTGSVGIQIGEINQSGAFRLEEAGIQRYDGLRLVLPNRDETLISFRDYQVDHGDRMRPEAGAMISLKEEFPAGTKVMWVNSQAVEHRYRPAKDGLRPSGEARGRVDMYVTQTQDTVTIRAVCTWGQTSHQIPVEVSTSGKSAPLRKLMFRFGDTDFVEGQWFGPEEVAGFIPPSLLKKGRRKLLEELTNLVGGGRELAIEDLIRQANHTKPVAPQPQREPVMVARIDRVDLLEAVLPYLAEHKIDIDFVPRAAMSTPNWKRALALLEDYPATLRLALPMVLRRWDNRLLKARLVAAKERFQHVVLSNPGHLPLVREHMPAAVRHVDFSVYHLNTWAWHSLADMGVNGRFTLSLEDDKPNMEALLAAVDPAQFEVIAYTDTPLFVAEACSLAALHGGCPGTKKCGHETLHIENEHGDQFHVYHDRCRSTVIGDNALSWSGRLAWFRDRGVHHYRMDFTTRPYTPGDVTRITAAVAADQPLQGTHTENLERLLL